jgi:hypothetical protein
MVRLENVVIKYDDISSSQLDVTKLVLNQLDISIKSASPESVVNVSYFEGNTLKSISIRPVNENIAIEGYNDLDKDDYEIKDGSKFDGSISIGRKKDPVHWIYISLNPFKKEGFPAYLSL